MDGRADNAPPYLSGGPRYRLPFFRFFFGFNRANCWMRLLPVSAT
jgi:hypothetical protein